MAARPAGPCKIAVGELEVTFVPDGSICGTPEGSYPGSPESLWKANPHLLDEEGRFVMSLGAILVRSGERRVLLDLGWGPTEQAIVDPALARRTMEQIEAELLRPNTVAAGPHFADLVFGRLLPGAGKRSWVFPEAQRVGLSS